MLSREISNTRKEKKKIKNLEAEIAYLKNLLSEKSRKQTLTNSCSKDKDKYKYNRFDNSSSGKIKITSIISNDKPFNKSILNPNLNRNSIRNRKMEYSGLKPTTSKNSRTSTSDKNTNNSHSFKKDFYYNNSTKNSYSSFKNKNSLNNTPNTYHNSKNKSKI